MSTNPQGVVHVGDRASDFTLPRDNAEIRSAIGTL